MTLDQFIYKITNQTDRIEFKHCEAGYDFIVSRLTPADNRYYRVHIVITHEMIYEMSIAGIDPWLQIYEKINMMFSEEMKKPYPVDSQQSTRNLVIYVTDFIKEHRIHSGEAIYQSDWDTLPYEFMDKCCEIIGYYEED